MKDIWVFEVDYCVILGFRRDVDGKCALLCYCAAYSSNSLTMFRDNISVPYAKAKTLEDGTDRLSRNVGKKLSPHAA
jgi:hypothetical protein